MSREVGQGDITRLLHGWREGDREAFEHLVPLVYQQLHNIALGLMRRERLDHTLQPTALLNELYVRLTNQQKITWSDRQQFFTFTAHLMRNILVDHARSHSAHRRGGPDRVRIPLTDDLPWLPADEEGILDLNRALERLEKVDERKSRLVELRFFLSCTAEEAAEILGISQATAERDLRFVKSWLYRELAQPPTSCDSVGTDE